MRKIILLLLLFVAPVMSYAEQANIKHEIIKLASNYEGKYKFEIIKLGSFELKLARLFADRDSRDAMKAMRNVKEMIIMEYDDCNPSVIMSFNEDAKRTLSNANLITEIVDEGEKVYLYGNANEDVINDFIIFVPSECSLICMFGTINVADMALLIEEYD